MQKTFLVLLSTCIILAAFAQKCQVKRTYMKKCRRSSSCLGNLICNDGSTSCNCPQLSQVGRCDCPLEYYWNGAQCEPASSYNELCHNSSANYMCKTVTEGTLCSTASSTSAFRCLCLKLQYFDFLNTMKCQNQTLDGTLCTQSDACRSDLGLNCINGVCSCPRVADNETYWNGTICTAAKGFNQSCLTINMCKTLTELTVCSEASFRCVCSPLQYYDLTTKKCTNQKSNAVTCSQANACRSDLGLSCQSGYCACTRTVASEYYWNATRCTLAAAYGNTCETGKNYTCQYLKEKTYCNSSNQCDCYNGIFSPGGGVCKFCAVGWKLIGSMCYGVDYYANDYFFVCGNPYDDNIGNAYLAKLDDPVVKNYFFSLSLPSRPYWVNAFRKSQVWPYPYFSKDDTWILNYPNSAIPWCSGSPSGLGNSVYMVFPSKCFSNEWRYQNYYAFCAKSPV